MEKRATISDSNRAEKEAEQSPQSPTKRRKEFPNQDDVHQSSDAHGPEYFMLLEEMCQSNKLPPSLGRLLHNLSQREIQSPAEILIAVVYYLFLESGFVPASLPAELKSKIRVHWGYSFVAQIPDYSWKIAANEISEQYEQLYQNAATSTVGQPEKIYDFKLNLLQHSNDNMQLTIRKIFGGAALCVIFSLTQQQQATSVILTVNEFINMNESSNIDQILQNPRDFLRNIQKLNGTIKQNLISPSRNVAMYESGCPNAALHGMPKEVLWTLFKYLRSDLETLQKVSQTCVYLRNMAVSYLNESNVKLKHRRPTPIIYDPSNQIGLPSRYRFFNHIPHIRYDENYPPRFGNLLFFDLHSH